jgi:hypothetical protein
MKNGLPSQGTRSMCAAVGAPFGLRHGALAFVQAEGAAIAAAVFASVTQAAPAAALVDQEGHALPEGQPGRPKARIRRPKKRADASPEDAAEALCMKAEAARIAAEAFAIAPQACTHALLLPSAHQLTCAPACRGTCKVMALLPMRHLPQSYVLRAMSACMSAGWP